MAAQSSLNVHWTRGEGGAILETVTDTCGRYDIRCCLKQILYLLYIGHHHHHVCLIQVVRRNHTKETVN